MKRRPVWFAGAATLALALGTAACERAGEQDKAREQRPAAGEATGAGTAARGPQPGQPRAEGTSVTGKIEGIDRAAGTLTLGGVNYRATAGQLESLQVGQSISLTWRDDGGERRVEAIAPMLTQ